MLLGGGVRLLPLPRVLLCDGRNNYPPLVLLGTMSILWDAAGGDGEVEVTW